MNTYLVIYFGAATLSLLATPWLIRLACAIGAMDIPGTRRIHNKPTARIGGAAIVIATIGMVVPVLLLNNTIGDKLRQNQLQFIGLLCTAGFMFAVGLIDDIRGVKARHKLLAQLAAAIMLCALGVRIEVLEVAGVGRAELGWLAWPLTIVWIIGITNAINLIDGLDGLAAGIAAITCGVIAVFSLHTGQPIMAVLMLAMFGGLTGFLFFGFNPAKIFLGDCGSLFLGFMLAGASVLSSTKTTTVVGLALPILAMGVPILDTLFSMLRRLLERRSIFAPDRSHIHHRLLAMGLHQRHVVLILYGVTILATGLGMFMMVTDDAGTLVVFGGVLLLLLIVFRVIGLVRLRSILTSVQLNLTRLRHAKQERQAFERAQVRLREATSFRTWWRAACVAAEDMGFARLVIRDHRPDGPGRTLLCYTSSRALEDNNTVRMIVPISTHRAESNLRAEVDVFLNGSLESAGRRMTLFGRLIDEQNFAGSWTQIQSALRPVTGDPALQRVSAPASDGAKRPKTPTLDSTDKAFDRLSA